VFADPACVELSVHVGVVIEATLPPHPMTSSVPIGIVAAGENVSVVPAFELLNSTLSIGPLQATTVGAVIVPDAPNETPALAGAIVGGAAPETPAYAWPRYAQPSALPPSIAYDTAAHIAAVDPARVPMVAGSVVVRAVFVLSTANRVTPAL
jgi:hypothetical protein